MIVSRMFWTGGRDKCNCGISTMSKWFTSDWDWGIMHSSHCENPMVSCQKSPTCHAYAWQIGPFWQDTLDYPAWAICFMGFLCHLSVGFTHLNPVPLGLMLYCLPPLAASWKAKQFGSPFHSYGSGFYYAFSGSPGMRVVCYFPAVEGRCCHYPASPQYL